MSSTVNHVFYSEIFPGFTPSDRSTVSPAGSTSGRLSHQDLVGYATIRSLRRQNQNSNEEKSDPYKNPFIRVNSLDRRSRNMYEIIKLFV